MSESRVRITGHTGCNGTSANTLDSAVYAIDAGADCVEVDVRTTVDGVPVLSHDDLFGDEDPLSISDSSFAQLAGTGTPPERLERLLELVMDRRVRVNLDLKDDRSAEAAFALVTNLDYLNRVVATGCDVSRAKKVLRATAHARVYLNVHTGRRGHVGIPSFIPGICRKARRAGCCGLNIDKTLYSRRFRIETERFGLRLSVWTVSREEEIRRLVADQVDNITTRDIILALSIRDGREGDGETT